MRVREASDVWRVVNRDNPWLRWALGFGPWLVCAMALVAR